MRRFNRLRSSFARIGIVVVLLSARDSAPAQPHLFERTAAPPLRSNSVVR